jgi:hypothetical protein
VHYEVISGGVAAYGTTRSMILYEHLGRKYDPDLVILCFTITNDVQDDFVALAQEEPLPGIYRQQFFRLTDEKVLEPFSAEVAGNITSGVRQAQLQADSRLKRIDAWLFTNSRFYFYVRPFLAEQIPPIRRALYQLGAVDSPVPAPPRYSRAPSAVGVFSAAWELEDALIARLRDEVTADNAAFAVAIVPDYVQIQTELLLQEYPLFTELMPQYMDLNQTDEALKSILEGHGIPYLWMRPDFEDVHAQGIDLYNSQNLHWNRAGQELAGNLLFDWLISEGLVPAVVPPP